VDTRENNGNSTKKEIGTRDDPTPDLELDYKNLRQHLRKSTQITVDHLDKLIKASSKRSNKRCYMELFRALVVDSARTSESLFFLFEYVTDLRASILLLSLEIDKANGKTKKDVEQLKTKINHLVNTPAVIEIGKILQNMQKVSQDRKIRASEKPVKEYLR
jgi:hypothetical protein